MLAFGHHHTPEELQQIHEAQRSRWERIDRALESMDAAQIGAVLDIVVLAMHDGSSLFYYKGIIEKMMYTKHDRCPCGTDHAEEIANSIHPNNETPEVPATPVFNENFHAQREADMKKYDMKIVKGNLVCARCGIGYVSMEDRMLKQPDDCHGCEVKNKWG